MSGSSWFRKLFGGKASFGEPRPDEPIYVIGDVHGCPDALQQLVHQAPHGVKKICVGDYIDRGDDSASVLRWLHSQDEITCLKGNHEAMMLSFVKDPAKRGRRWIKYGGLQTLASFGIHAVSETAGKEALVAARDAFVQAVGPDILEWVVSCPSSYETGNVAVVHAGADPDIPIAMQSDETLIWGHPQFDRKSRTDGIWIVHGHTIVPLPKQHNGRISIDTGAYATGRLTAALIEPDGTVTFTQT